MMRREILEGLGPTAYVQNASLMLYPHAWIARNNEKLRGLEAQLVANFPPTEIMVSRIEAIMAFDRSEELSRIKAPTLVVAAADDMSRRPITARRWPGRSRTPNSRCSAPAAIASPM